MLSVNKVTEQASTLFGAAGGRWQYPCRAKEPGVCVCVRVCVCVELCGELVYPYELRSSSVCVCVCVCVAQAILAQAEARRPPVWRGAKGEGRWLTACRPPRPRCGAAGASDGGR